MALQYFCDNPFRAQRLRTDPAISLNGIDYLEVLDQESPVETLRQRTLMVRLFRSVPSTLVAGNVRITGGVRITPIAVEWIGVAGQAAALEAAGLINGDERTYFSSLSDPDQVLLIRTDSDGDYSPYTLSLIASPTATEPPPGFDPILSTVEFSFKAECPTLFDCRKKQSCPPEPFPAPVINYLAKDYATFRQLLLDRMAVTLPRWKESHIPDLNMALVELLAYTGDYLSYYQDSVATEAYLNTARRRTSLRRHARLLNYPMHDGCNARTWVFFTADAGVNATSLAAPTTLAQQPVRLLTRMPSEPRTLKEADLERLISEQAPTVFELQQTVVLYHAHNSISLYTWGDEACCLPTGATRATLRSSTDADKMLHLAAGDVLLFEEVRSPKNGLAADANPSHRQAVRLTLVEPTLDPLDGTPVVNIAWDLADALTFPLCLSVRLGTTLVSDVSVARGNMGLADHGQRVPQEHLPPQKGLRHYRPLLAATNVTMREPIDHRRPAARMLDQDPAAALPVIELTGDGENWLPQRDLLDSDRFAPHFVAESEEDGRVYLRFGDKEHYGLSPSTDAFSQGDNGALYRVGSGPEGNIGADTLFHLIGFDTSGVVGVRNPLPAAGGTERQSRNSVRHAAPQAFRRQERAVTASDYAAVATRHSSVQRAEATRRWTGSWYTTFVTVDPLGGEPATDSFEHDIRLHLEKYRLTGHDLEIDLPQLVPLDIRMTVCVQPEYFRSDVESQLLQVFSSRTAPDGQKGFFHPDNFTFGQSVYLSEVIATAMEVTGVQWVDILPHPEKDHRFQRWGKTANEEIALGRIAMSRLEVAQLENDPSRPENGCIILYMEGGQ